MNPIENPGQELRAETSEDALPQGVVPIVTSAEKPMVVMRPEPKPEPEVIVVEERVAPRPAPAPAPEPSPVLSPAVPAVPSHARQSWGVVISIVVIVLMIVIGAFYAWGQRIAEQQAFSSQVLTQ